MCVVGNGAKQTVVRVDLLRCSESKFAQKSLQMVKSPNFFGQKGARASPRWLPHLAPSPPLVWTSSWCPRILCFKKSYQNYNKGAWKSVVGLSNTSVCRPALSTTLGIGSQLSNYWNIYWRSIPSLTIIPSLSIGRIANECECGAAFAPPGALQAA